VSAINFAELHQLVFDMCCLQKLVTNKHTDTTEYIISRTAGG